MHIFSQMNLAILIFVAQWEPRITEPLVRVALKERKKASPQTAFIRARHHLPPAKSGPCPKRLFLQLNHGLLPCQKQSLKYGHGSNPNPTSEHPNPTTKIGSKIGPPKWDPTGFDPRPHDTNTSKLASPWLASACKPSWVTTARRGLVLGEGSPFHASRKGKPKERRHGPRA